MNDISDQLKAAESAPATFDTADVENRVATRSRRHRRQWLGAALTIAAVGVTVAFLALRDNDSDVETAEPAPAPSSTLLDDSAPLTGDGGQTLDLASLQGWVLASVDGSPALVAASIQPASINAITITITNCGGGGDFQLRVDNAGDVLALSVTASSEVLCEGTAPTPAQADIVDDVLSAMPSATTEAGRFVVRSGAHSLVFVPPAESPAAGLVGEWTAAFVDGIPGLSESMSLDVSETEFLLSGCALGFGAGFEWDAEATLQLGEQTSSIRYYCTSPAEPVQAEAEELSQLLHDAPRVRVLPEAFVVDAATRSAVFVRRATTDNAEVTALTDGEPSDIHIEAPDLAFPACPADRTPPDAERRRELEDFYLGLLVDGLLDDPEFVNSIDATFDGGLVRVNLERRYQPTIDWFVAHADPRNLCLSVLVPPGYYTGPPDLLDWRLDSRVPVTATDRRIAIGGVGQCGLDVFGSTWRETADQVEVALLFRRWPGDQNDCPGFYPVEVELAEPLGDRPLLPATSPVTIWPTTDSEIRAGDTIALEFDPIVLRDHAAVGDDIMLQRIDDPTVQIQIGGVFTAAPSAGPPSPIVQDRWAASNPARILIPADASPGDYSIVFIDDPYLNGVITVG